MTFIQDGFQDVFPSVENKLATLSEMLNNAYNYFNNVYFLIEISIIACIIVLSIFLQKIILKWFLNTLSKIKQITWSQKIIFTGLFYTEPAIALFLTILAMGITAIFSTHIEMYKIFIKLNIIWFICLCITHTISDMFVRFVVYTILIPFLIFSAIGFSNPVIKYLDSLGFTLAGVNFSLFLILKGVLVATCLFWIARIITKLIFSFIESQKKMTVEIRDLLQNIIQVVLYTTVIFITLDSIGIDLKSLAIIGGAIGIGIGLGLQKIAANFISGIILLFEQNIKVGHLVEVSGSSGPGWISHLGARASIIDTGDGKKVLIPNEELLTKTLVDWTYKDRQIRTDLRIKVTFRSDLEKAKKILVEAAADHPFCSKSYTPTCFLEKFTDSGAQFLLQFWVDDLAVGKMVMQNDVLMTIWKQFAKEGIEFASPVFPGEDNLTT